MPGLGGLAGILTNPALEQILLYNVVGSLVGAGLGPYLVALTNEVNSVSPLVPLSPADAADAVIRTIWTEEQAAAEARFAGIDGDRFAVLAKLAGNAPDPTSLAIALRRGLIDEPRYLLGIAQGRLRNEWAELIKELAVVQPTPADALTGLVEAQLSEEDARAKYAAFGGDPTQFDWLLGTVGAGPSPLEAADMAHRGLIPWDGTGLGVVSFDQAVAEGHTRTKWTKAYRGLANYLPPPRTVTALLKEGAITEAEARTIFEQSGLTPQLADTYVSAASSQKVSKPKELAESTVLALYRDRLVPRAEAQAMIEALGYTPAEAEFTLEVEDLRVTEAAVRAAVGRVHTLYTSHKITAQAAGQALADLGIEAAQAGDLLTVWAHERAANVRTLTPAQIASALGDSILTQAEAQALLEEDGYTPHDAWVVLSVHAKAPLPNEPATGGLPAGAGP